MSHYDRKVIFITGGIRSGKSRFAQELAIHYGTQVRYVATAEARDKEMEKRIQLHRQNRPDSWLTVEEPIELSKIINMDADRMVTLIDCITIWVSNLLIQKDMEGMEHWQTAEGLAAAEEKVDDFLAAIQTYPGLIIIVSNEVGWGGIEINPLGRVYQDILGWTNQKIAAIADEVYLVASGIPMQLKGEKKDEG